MARIQMETLAGRANDEFGFLGSVFAFAFQFLDEVAEIRGRRGKSRRAFVQGFFPGGVSLFQRRVRKAPLDVFPALAEPPGVEVGHAIRVDESIAALFVVGEFLLGGQHGVFRQVQGDRSLRPDLRAGRHGRKNNKPQQASALRFHVILFGERRAWPSFYPASAPGET